MLPALSEGKTTDSETEAIEDTAVKEANEAVLDTDFSEGVNDSKAKVTVRIRTQSVIVQPTLEGRDDLQPCKDQNSARGTATKSVENDNAQKQGEVIVQDAVCVFSTALIDNELVYAFLVKEERSTYSNGATCWLPL